MLQGRVRPDGTPVVLLTIAGSAWTAIIDTGFNGDLELPESLRVAVNPRYQSEVVSVLAGGQSVVEDLYDVDFSFDGRTVLAESTFVSSNEILIGTHLLLDYCLQIDFPVQSVTLTRTS
jgi:predicted aspartyl protease